MRPEVRIVDFTGSTAFGQWLEEHARQAAVYTEKAGVNMVLVDSTDDYAGMLANLAFSLCLYSGQMCTTPQDLLVPADGIGTRRGARSRWTSSRPTSARRWRSCSARTRRRSSCSARSSTTACCRVWTVRGRSATVLIPSRTLTHPAYPQARVRTPALVRVPADRVETLGRGVLRAGLVPRRHRHHRGRARADAPHGDRPWRAHRGGVLDRREGGRGPPARSRIESGVALSENLTGGVYVNQTAAYSDLHATGANPAANAAYTDAHFVAGRFRVIQTRRHTT